MGKLDFHSFHVSYCCYCTHKQQPGLQEISTHWEEAALPDLRVFSSKTGRLQKCSLKLFRMK